MSTTPVMAWLAGLPLTLLCDLVSPGGPDSWAILATERARVADAAAALVPLPWQEAASLCAVPV